MHPKVLGGGGGGGEGGSGSVSSEGWRAVQAQTSDNCQTGAPCPLVYRGPFIPLTPDKRLLVVNVA